ncbi:MULTISPECIES: hypothetical protein [Flavobacterium]|uniref:Uncharacterized protein n=1 Tax=Flavobacterium jumunjinense TaxID=998845 RepID=A0ABV5GQZ6_9FLAO|nr:MULTISPECIES: hypothetical protein [Flavobacterium]
MKKRFNVLLLLASTFIFGQVAPKDFDYFVQFNGSQFSKKVTLDEIMNHNAIKKIAKSEKDFNIKDYTSLIKSDKNVTIHGNFSDSIPFYQITIPIKNREEVKAFVMQKIKENSEKISDEVTTQIEDYDTYTVYNSSNTAASMAWNDEYLVILEFIKPKNSSYNDPYAYEVVEPYEEDYDYEYGVEEDRDSVQFNIDDLPPPPPSEYEDWVEVVEAEAVIESTEVEEAVEWVEVEEEVIESTEDYDYDYEEEDNEYLKQLEEEKAKRKEMQNMQIEYLFSNGFVLPFSAKINTKADISTWVNYKSAFSSIRDLTSSMKYIFGRNTSFTDTDIIENYINGMNFDFYFENDKARVEEVIEYSSSLAEVMNKVSNRKINKSIYKYFPNQDPLGYMTYHINSKELLNSYPKLIEQMYSGNPYFGHDDMSIVVDLMATMIDEEAVSTLFDGDLSMFLHDIKKEESSYTTYEYDENYDEVEVEKTIQKTIPVFTMLFTSTHKTMADKLFDLGVRKGGLIKRKGYYEVKGSSDMGALKLIKDGDVIVITNGLEYLINGKGSNFSKSIIKDSKQNTMSASVNLKDLIVKYVTNEDFGKDTTKMLKVSQQFEKVEMKSSKKLKNNKQSVEMILHSSNSDKNIILQTLDLVDFLND